MRVGEGDKPEGQPYLKVNATGEMQPVTLTRPPLSSGSGPGETEGVGGGEVDLQGKARETEDVN